MFFNCYLAPNLRKHGVSSAKAGFRGHRWLVLKVGSLFYVTDPRWPGGLDIGLVPFYVKKKKERGLTWQAWSIKEKDTFVLKELCKKSLMGKMDPLSRLGSQLDWQDLLCGFSRSAMFKLETNARTGKLSIGFVCTMLSQRVWWAKSQSSILNNYLITQWNSVLFSNYSFPLRFEYLITLHQSEAQYLSYIWLSAFEFGATQLRFVTKMAPKSPFEGVNRSPIRYGLRVRAASIKFCVWA